MEVDITLGSGSAVQEFPVFAALDSGFGDSGVDIIPQAFCGITGIESYVLNSNKYNNDYAVSLEYFDGVFCLLLLLFCYY